MANVVKQTFTANGNWTAPAGVWSVRATALSPRPAFGDICYEGASIVDSQLNWVNWGSGTLGILGNNGTSNSTSATGPGSLLPYVQFQKITTSQQGGTRFGLGLNGVLWGAGSNANGQLGNASVTPASSPVIVGGSLRFINVYANYMANVYGLAPNGALYAWGINSNGCLGVGDTTPRSSPTVVAGGLTFANVIPGKSSAGNCFGLDSSGNVWGWGDNSKGSLGDGTSTNRSSPVQVVGGLTFAKISVGAVNGNGNTYILGITTSGDMYAWGLNSNGNLGTNDVTSRSSPVLVVGGLKWSYCYATELGQSYGITTGGVSYAWGTNNNIGALGIGAASTSVSSPVQILGSLTFSKIVACQNFGMGLTTAGALYAWGSGGKLGDGTIVPKSSPVLVAGGLTWADMQFETAFATDAYAITTGGQVYAWGGNNSNGELGVGDTNTRSSPVAVVGAFLANLVPASTVTTIPVVPGTTYALSFQSGSQALFGTTAIGGGQTTSVTLEYQQ